MPGPRSRRRGFRMNRGNVPPVESENTVRSESKIKNITVVRPAISILPVNTNLNLAPSNWQNRNAESFGLKDISTQSGFSSFQLANQYIDCINKVDIVSDAENIKQIFTIPFSKKPISMMVHRIGDTLLIDEFNASAHLVMQKKNRNWDWLKEFFSNHFSETSEIAKYVSHKVNSSNVIKEKTLLLKFLHHSIANKQTSSNNSKRQQQTTTTSEQVTFTSRLPNPCPEELFPDYHNIHNFNQTMLCTFEDVRMLIGSDLPIFKQGAHSLSLRLRNLSKPMNISTVVDYWLDNLMCNVPKVLLCDHLEGIVQKYEKLNTEELPYYGDKFLPNVFKYITHNILSFLKTKVSKVGHTYWLFRGKNESMTQIYDLTSLCFDSRPQDQNIFTIPVAMLLYRIAQSWFNSPIHEINMFDSIAIERLLYYSLEFLKGTNHHQIEISIIYLFCELYYQSYLKKDSKFNTIFWTRKDLADQNDSKLINSIDMNSLCTPLNIIHTSSKSRNSSPECVKLSDYECFDKSFYYLRIGLEHLRNKTNIKLQVKMLDDLNMALSSFELNPKVTKVGLKKKKKNRNSPKVNNKISIRPTSEDEWKQEFRRLFFEKASLLLFSLSVANNDLKKYGNSLKYMRIAYECRLRVSNDYALDPVLELLLHQCGIYCLNIATEWHNSEQYKIELETVEFYDSIIINFLEEEDKNYSHPDLKLVPRNLKSKYDMFKAAEMSLKLTLDYVVISEDIKRIKNNLGLVYKQYILECINQIESVLDISTPINPLVLKDISRSFEKYFKPEICRFVENSDIVNLSQLYSNGCLMYSLTSICTVVKDDSPYADKFVKIYDNKARKYFNLSYTVLNNCSLDHTKKKNCYQYMAEKLFDIVVKYDMLIHHSCEVEVIERVNFWLVNTLQVLLYQINLDNSDTVTESVTSNTSKKVSCKHSNAFSLSINQCMIMGTLNRLMILEELQLTRGIKSKVDCFKMIIFYLGQCSNLSFHTDHEQLPKKESAKTHHFDQTELFKILVLRLIFLLKHLTKLSLNETNILSTQKHKIKTLYLKLILYEDEIDYPMVINIIKEISDFQFVNII